MTATIKTGILDGLKVQIIKENEHEELNYYSVILLEERKAYKVGDIMDFDKCDLEFNQLKKMKTENEIKDDIDNLLMNMSGGLLPEHLCEEEVSLLKSRYGENWFEKLGYKEPKYRKPKVSKFSN